MSHTLRSMGCTRRYVGLTCKNRELCRSNQKCANLDATRGAISTTLRTSTLVLVYASTEYCTPVWCVNGRTCHIVKCTNDMLRTVTGCLRPIPMDQLHAFAGISLTELRCRRATLRVNNLALVPEQLLYQKFAESTSHRPRLKWKHLFEFTALELLYNNSGQSVVQWTEHTWSVEWQSKSTRLHIIIPSIDNFPVRTILSRPAWRST